MPESFAPSKAVIVSHTHWDREWYKPFHEFRVDLLRVVRQVLDALEEDGAFEHFLLDGQAVILDDYLQIFPSEASRIRRLVAAGKLSIGPWYVLPDEFLVSGEATIRNLLIGHRVCAPMGGAQRVGYMPDSFGHIAQLPQILARAGIDSFIYTRGNGDEIEELGYEYQWVGPDGSTVLAVNQCGGYCNAGGLGFEEEWQAHTQRAVDIDLAVRRIADLFERMRPLSRGDVFLISNGCDHFPPQQQFGRILDALRRAFPETELKHGSLEDYVAAVRQGGYASTRYAGELIRGRMHLILSGVWSARMYLKQHNDAAQTILSDCLEPLAAYGHFMLGRPYPREVIDYAWKLLLQNHPHDSICGCSTDAVHREMVTRFDGVVQSVTQLLRAELAHLTPTFGRAAEADRETVIGVANPLAEVRTEVVERVVALQPFGTEVERLEVLDQDGAAVPFRILDTRYADRFWHGDYRTDVFGMGQRERLEAYVEHFSARMDRGETERDRNDCFLTLQFLARDLPAVGHRQYRLRERAGPPAAAEDTWLSIHGVRVTADSLENEFYEVRVHENGTFDVRDKATGWLLAGLNRLEDTEDVGDEYDYAPCAETETVTSDGLAGVMRTLDDGGLLGRIEAECILSLPSGIAPDRQRRSADRVGCRCRSRITLTAGSRVIEVDLVFDNRAEDHRLRAEFPTGVVTDTVISDGQFYVNRRSIEQPRGETWRQPPAGTYPQQDFTLVEDGNRGLAVMNRGLPEIQAGRDQSGRVTLSLTLLRAVGWLSRDDFDTRRRSNAGPSVPTPDAQCPGEQRFRYAVVPYSGDYVSAGIKSLSRRFKVPVLSIQGVEDGSVTGGRGLVSRVSDRICISAIKRHETEDHLLVRLYNLTGEDAVETLMFGVGVERAWLTDLLEVRRMGELAVEGTSVKVPLGPYEVGSVEIRLLDEARDPASRSD